MLNKFWESVGGKLSDRWLAVGTPALVYWVGALLAWMLGHGGLSALNKPADAFGSFSTPAQLVLLVGGLAGVAASGLIVERMTVPALKVLEGFYWPTRWSAPRIEKHQQTARRNLQRFQELEVAAAQPGAVGNAQERAQLTADMRRFPAKPPYQATRVGNTLAAAERRPLEKYGLSATMIWSHLWLVMPDTARTEVSGARTALNGAVAACCWGILFLPFGLWTPLALPAGLAVTLLAVLVWVPDRTNVYADLVEASFDLYRPELYAKLRWPLPASPDLEQEQGKLVSEYLVRGSDATTPAFTVPKG